MHRMIARENIEICKAEARIIKTKYNKVLEQLLTEVQLYLSSSYGKNSLNHLFTTDIAFCHILFYFESSGFSTKENLLQLNTVSRTTNDFFKLITEYKDIKFNELRANDGFPTYPVPNQKIDMKRYVQLTAATIH